MGASSSAASDMTIRYSQNVEDNYKQLLWYYLGGDGRVTDALLDRQPYSFQLANFVDVFYDLYYNYYTPKVKDKNIYTGLTWIYGQFIENSVVDAQIAAHGIYLEDDIVQNVIPKLKAGLRDIGAVMTSSFFDAQAMVEINKQKVLSKFSADLKMKMFDLSQDIWTKSMEWNWNIMKYQTNLIDLYYKVGTNYNKFYNDVDVGNYMWPFTILDQARAAVGALNGAQGAKSGRETATPSGISTAASYVGVAASVASMYGGLSGAAGSVAEGAVESSV